MIPQPIDTVPLFQRLSGEERQLVTLRLKRRQVTAGQVIISEGEPGNTLFIINSGWVKLESGSANNTVTLANLGAGSLIGEVDVLQGRPYSMTAHAATNTALLTLTRADLEYLINERPSIGLKFSTSMGLRIPFLEDYLVQQRLRHIELLSALALPDLQAIAKKLDFRHCERGEVIFDAGAPGNAAFFIEEGIVRLITKTSEGESFEDQKEGTIFGHTALMTHKPYPSTARAVSEVIVWVLSQADYQVLIKEHPAVKPALSRALAEPLNANDQSDAVERMRQLHLFNDAPDDALAILASRLVLRHFPADEIIYSESTPGDAMYIVESGEIRLQENAAANAQLLERVRAGEAFGEMALLTGRTRAECARAATDSTVWVLYKTEFEDVMVQYPEISLSLSRALSERLTTRESDMVIRHLRRIKLLSDLAGSELKALSKRVHGLRFRPGEIICFVGQPAQTLYMIEKGQVKRMTTGMSGEPVMLDILDAGDSFGDQEIVQNAPLASTAQAMSETELWTITKQDFLKLMEEYPTLALTVTRLMAERLTRAQTMPPMQPRPRPVASTIPPRPPAARPPAAPPPPPSRVQRPPSGARPIKPATAEPPKTPPIKTTVAKPAAVSTPVAADRKPAVTSTPVAATTKPATPATEAKPQTQPTPPKLPHLQAPHLPHIEPPKLPHLQVPHIPAPHLPHVQAPHLHAPKLPHVQAPHVPDVAGGTKHFFQEFGGWARGLSLGAKLRVLTLGMLALWFLLIAGPWTTFTTVSSAVGGLQLFNSPEETVIAQKNNSNSSTTANGSGSKVAMAVPTNTPVPTRTPQPTFTPRPQPTLAPATRTPAPKPTAAPAAAGAAPAPALPALPPAYIDPRLVPGSGKELPLVNQFKLIPAAVGHGQKFWRITRVVWEDITESGNDHTIYVYIKDESGKRVDAKLKAWGEGSGPISVDQKKADDMCQCNYGIDMWGDGYGVQVDEGLPSDQATGMIMPMRRHVNYKITYQLTTNP